MYIFVPQIINAGAGYASRFLFEQELKTKADVVLCQAGENATTWKEILVCSLQDPFIYMKIVSSRFYVIFHIMS